MDVNESIVKKYFELKGYFVKTNIKYPLGGGTSDIDLMILHPLTSKRAIVEVKEWKGKFSKAQAKRNPKMFNFLREEALEKARNVFGTNDFEKILVIHSLLKDKVKREEAKKYVKEMGIDQLITFNDVLEYLITQTEENPYYSESVELQLIKLFKKYKKLKNNESKKLRGNMGLQHDENWGMNP